ncbi:HotDog domain-containing protein [Rhodotorula diobovata]|uniref:HotDog domain-containing protein n=1 Tax=Rhodotorula diobovata TaxID=5288 RepID=A0A5C5G2A0_9BASI|nr:HotDog domain-containing protein [Rhodotorula diobovata]
MTAAKRVAHGVLPRSWTRPTASAAPPPLRRLASTGPSSRPSLATTAPSGPPKPPRRSLFLLSTALLSTGLVAGYAVAVAAPRPQLVSLVFPVPTPHPPPSDHPDAVENRELIEKGLHELDVVKRLKEDVVPLAPPAPESSSSSSDAAESSLVKAAANTAEGTATSPSDTALAPKYTLSRPYASTPPGPHSLSGYTLRGPGKFAVPPLVFTTRDKKESVLVVHVGGGMCGHEGVVHGGLLATVLDEAMGRTALQNLPTNIGVTATLSMRYKKPTFANQYLVIRTSLTKQQGRKAWVHGRIENTEGETLVEAESLFVEPKFAQFLSNSSVREALK